jgi:Spy/CpxP family protein refolding chaperone
MFLRNKLMLAGLALLTLLGAAAHAQQPPSSTQNQSRDPETRRRGRRDEPRGMRRFGQAPLAPLRELNLSDEQKQQVRTIMERNFAATKSQREELRTLGQKRFEGTLTPDQETRAKELHKQMTQSMKSAMTEVQEILTAEQQTKLEELRKEQGPRRGRHGRRFGGPDSNESQNPPKP